MTLEDFFTLTEMRDGLSSLARVEELISMIQNMNDSVTNNLGDAVRQWSTVVNVLTATGNRECLDQFIQLNGLSFLNRWLQDALKFTTDVSSAVVEELICSLLSFFERSPIEYKWISASGIGSTIKLLRDHKTILINEMAKILYNKWNHAMDDDVSRPDQDKCGSDHDQIETFQTGHDQAETSQAVQTDDNPVRVVNPVIDFPPSTDGTDEAKCGLQSVGTEFQVANVTRYLDSSLTAPTDSTKETVQESNQVLSASTNPILADADPSGSSPVSNSCQENLPITEASSACVVVGQPSSGTCSKLGQEGAAEDQHDASVSKDVPLGSAKEVDVDVRENTQYESNQTEICSNSSSLAFSASVTPLVAAVEQTTSCKLDSIKSPSDAIDDKLASDHQKEKCFMTTKESNPTANPRTDSHNLTSTATIISNSSDLPVSSQQGEATSSVVVKDLDVEVKRKTRKDRFVTSNDFLKVVGNKTKVENGQKSEVALECLDDALEVARQVAIAVEREVVDYREPFCSSPEGNSGETTGSHSPNSEGKQKEPVTEEAGANSSAARKDYSDTSSPEKGSEITENVSSEPELSEQDIESAKPEVPSSESVGKSMVDRCTFDLNSDICSDEPECLLKPTVKMPINVSAPVAVVPLTGAPGLPVAICFGGEMGWKGSAATSAFRPASPRRTPDPGIKQKSTSLGIDLNVAERFDEVDDEPISVNKLPASSSLPYGDSFVEISSRTEKLNLDLNQLGDDDTSTYPHSSWKLHSQNGERSLSSASSSSSRQPSRRDFDLNDNPSFPDSGSSYNFSILSTKISESHGGSVPRDPVIKIMGSKIAVEKKDNVIQDRQNFLPNGTKVEPAIFPRQLLPCTNTPTAPYGYTGFLAGPAMSVSPAYYPPGSISYMVDSRGATTFMPHLTGSGGSALQSARPPFLLGATGMPSNMAGFGSSRPGFDLNSGMASVESGSREGSSFKQFLWQGHSSWKEEQTNPSSQPSSSATALKRKEPDTGWEPYSHGNKKMTSWQS